MIGTVLKVGILAFVGGVLHSVVYSPWPKPPVTMAEREFIQPVRERQQVLHDIPWYVANDAARNATLQWCQASSERDAMPDCRNAERATAGTALKRQPRDPLSYLDDPAYWRANPVARHATLEACRHPEWSSYQLERRNCAIARAVDGEGR